MWPHPADMAPPYFAKCTNKQVYPNRTAPVSRCGFRIVIRSPDSVRLPPE